MPLTHSRTHVHTTHTHTHTHTHTLHTLHTMHTLHTHTYTHIQTHTHTNAQSILTHTHCIHCTHTHTNTHIYKHTHIYKQTHTIKPTHTHSLAACMQSHLSRRVQQRCWKGKGNEEELEGGRDEQTSMTSPPSHTRQWREKRWVLFCQREGGDCVPQPWHRSGFGWAKNESGLYALDTNVSLRHVHAMSVMQVGDTLVLGRM